MIIFDSGSLLCSTSLEYYIDNYFTINIGLSVEDFSGKRNFCISLENLNLFIDQSEEILKMLNGTIVFEDYDSDSCLSFTVTKSCLSIFGTFISPSEDLKFEFLFQSDQTFLNNFVSFLKNIKEI